MDLQLNKCDATTKLTPTARRLHLAILTGFTATGHPPTRDELTHTDLDTTLTELVHRDVIALDEHGEIRAAYPFSPIPTPHLVTWDGGPTVHAMCAIDALGMSAMLARPVTITSTEPDTGHPITIQVNQNTAMWSPDTTVVYAATTSDTCCPSVDRTCSHINFFTIPDAAHTWAARHPSLTGILLDQNQALANGIAEFGTMMVDDAGQRCRSARGIFVVAGRSWHWPVRQSWRIRRAWRRARRRSVILASMRSTTASRRHRSLSQVAPPAS